MVSNLSIFSKRMLIFIWVVDINDVIKSISIFLNDWFQHLVWNIILPILWWWLETCWAHWIDLSHRLFSIVDLLRHSLVSNLSILSKGMLIFIWIVDVSNIVESISVFLDKWLQHLMRDIILPVFGWWL